LTDVCQDKILPYDVRETEYALIEAAIGLANWLTARPEVTEKQLEAVNLMRLFLQNLPAPPPLDLNEDFGFEIQPDDPEWDGGHLGSWAVSVCRAMFEIFCVGRDDLSEFSWELCPGRLNRNDLSNAIAWIEQVAAPEKLLLPGQRIVIEASTWSVNDT